MARRIALEVLLIPAITVAVAVAVVIVELLILRPEAVSVTTPEPPDVPQ